MMGKVVVIALLGAYMAFAVALSICPSSLETIINPNNFSEFIQCQGNTPITIACPSDLLYDPNKEECNYPDKIEIPKNYCKDPDIVYKKPHYCDCTKYVFCVNGEGTTIKCPSPEQISSNFVDFKNVCDCNIKH